MTQKRSEKKKTPTSKAVLWYFVALGTIFLIYCCVEMHLQHDLSPMAYVAPTVLGFMTAISGVYVYRAKKTDEFVIALKKAEIEKEKGIKIDSLGDDSQNNYMEDFTNGNGNY